MAELYRLNQEAPEDTFLNVIAMMISNISIKKIDTSTYEYSFMILQNENGISKLTYTCKSKEQELKLINLPKPAGNLVFMSHCIKKHDSLELEYDPGMAVVAFRPNNFQVEKFLQDIIQIFPKF